MVLFSEDDRKTLSIHNSRRGSLFVFNAE